MPPPDGRLTFGSEGPASLPGAFCTASCATFFTRSTGSDWNTCEHVGKGQSEQRLTCAGRQPIRVDNRLPVPMVHEARPS